jgi:hypothetical protein
MICSRGGVQLDCPMDLDGAGTVGAREPGAVAKVSRAYRVVKRSQLVLGRAELTLAAGLASLPATA